MARTQAKTSHTQAQAQQRTEPHQAHNQNVVAPAPTPRNGPTHEQIAKRAYELYIARGCQHGHHEEDWNQAERELKLNR